MVKVSDQKYFNFFNWQEIDKSVVKGAIDDILTVAGKLVDKPTKGLNVLDVGSGAGSYSFEIEKRVNKVISVEPYTQAYKQANINKRKKHSKVIFYNCPIEDFDTSEKFDLILSLTTLEHMPDAKSSFLRMLRLLKNNGFIYMTAPNKLWPIESHYGLPFLALLPLPLANKYLQIFKRGDSYEDSSYSKTYTGLRSFLNDIPCRYSFYLPENENSAYIGCNNSSFSYNLVKKLGMKLIKYIPFFWFFSKGFIVIIQKK